MKTWFLTTLSVSKHGDLHRRCKILNCFLFFLCPPLSSPFLPFPGIWQWEVNMDETQRKKWRTYTHADILFFYYIRLYIQPINTGALFHDAFCICKLSLNINIYVGGGGVEYKKQIVLVFQEIKIISEFDH